MALIVFSTATIMSGCGGGGSSSTPTDPITIAPSSPAPTSSPPPPPPVQFTASVGGPAIGRFYFDANENDRFDTGELEVTSNRSGEFGLGVTDRIGTSVNNPPSTAISRIRGLVLDIHSGLVYQNLATPLGGTVLSPLTTLVTEGESPPQMISALGLSSGPSALNPSTDILTFASGQNLASTDAVRVADAARITSINLELIGFAAAIGGLNQANPADGPIDLLNTLGAVSFVIARPPYSSRLDDPLIVHQILDSYLPATFRNGYQENRTAAAQLLANYVAAVPDRVSSPEDIGKIQRTLRFYIIPEIANLILRGSSTDRSRVAAITPSTIQTVFAFFGGAPATPISGTFFPTADVRSIPSNRLLDLNGCSSTASDSPICNDYIFANGLVTHGDATILSVSLDGTNANKMTVMLNSSGRITIDPVNTFNGLAFFDYLARSSDGQSAKSRVYVRISPDDGVVVS